MALGLDEQLAAVADDEEEKKRNFDALQNEDRLNRGQGIAGRVKDEAIDRTKDYVREQAERRAAQASQRAGRVAANAAKTGSKVAKRIVATGLRALLMNPYVWGVLGVIIIVCFLLYFLILSMSALYSYCNESGVTGFTIRTLASEYCESFKLATDKATAPSRREAFGSREVNSLGLVPISGVPVENLPAARSMLRPCMLARLQSLYAEAQAQGVGSFVVTSAYRPESNGSYHQSGEAFDLAFRNPVLGYFSNDPRIATVIAIAKAQGLVPPAADVVDEYNRPSARTEGPHIHIEVNGADYC